MKKIILSLALAVGAVFAATDVVWNSEGDGTKVPAYWYGYADPADGSLSSYNYSADEIVKSAELSVTAGSKSNSAGFGFGWQQNASYQDVAISLASYKGVCMTYRATAPFRVDFKQSTIADFNYYGAELSAASKSKKVFIDFADLAQGWKSSTSVSWNAEKQMGVQFAFKESHAKASDVSSNTIEIAEFILSDSCVTNPPILTAQGEALNDSTLNLDETDTLKLVLAELFEDEDGDDLAVSVKILTSGVLTLLNSQQEFGLADTLRFLPKANSDDYTILYLSATDGQYSVSLSMTVRLHDVDNPPTAVDDVYSMKEDEVLTVPLKESIYLNDFSIDGADFDLNAHTEPAHGILVLEETGAFTYTPEANYCGEDSWKYSLKDARSSVGVSAEATVTIQIACINDLPTITILDSFIVDLFSNAEIDEDAEEKTISFAKSALEIKDVDGDKLDVGAYGDSTVNAELLSLSSQYAVLITPRSNQNGEATVTIYATDKKDTAKILFTLTVNPVADPPVAVNDTIYGYSDSSLVVSAKKGVLVNDFNPDGETVLSAYLKTDARNGTVELATDGSLIYTPTDVWMADSFSYYVVNAEGDTSEVAQVYVNLNMPKVLVALVDTTAREDFTVSLRFSAATVKSWFSSEKKLYFSAKSDDGKLNPTFSAAGILNIYSVKDSCGDAYVTVFATDSISGVASMKIHVALDSVNDRPRAVRDTIEVLELSGFVVSIDLDTIFSDPENDPLSYELFKVGNNALSAELSGSILTVTPSTDSTELSPRVYTIQVKGWETDGDSTKITAYIYLAIGGKTGIAPQMAPPKISWQRAILSHRGKAMLFDLNGHLLWQSRLPVSESAVRQAATRSAGRTILRVNSSQWLLSSEKLK